MAAVGVMAMIAACPAADIVESPVPEMRVTTCSPPPNMDGVLTDACWQSAAVITNFNVLGKPGASRPVRAWAAHDDEWLYLAVAVSHPKPDDIKTSVRQHGGSIHADDSIEIFIDPGTDARLYFQLLLNAANVSAEKMVTGEAAKTNPLIPWRSGTARTAAGWNAEMAVPLSFLSSYGDLSRMRMNLNLNLITTVYDQYHAKLREEHEWSSWAPVARTFHEPERFGFVRGLESVQVRAPFFPQIRNVKVGRYVAGENGYAYEITAEAGSYFQQPGKAGIMVEDFPVNGGSETTDVSVAVAGGGWSPVSIKVPVKNLQARTAVVHVRDAEHNVVMQTVLLGDSAMAELDLMRVYLNRSYYTTETGAMVICRISLPNEELRRMSLTAFGRDSQVLGALKEPTQHAALPIALSAVEPGLHPVRVALKMNDGGIIVEKNLDLIKRAAKQDCEWKIDRVNRTLLCNGQPFFGFGFVVSHFTEAKARDLSASGFNTVCVLNTRLTVDDAARHKELAEKYRLCLIDYLDGYINTNAPFYFKYTVIDRQLPEAEREAQFNEASRAKLELVDSVINIWKDSPWCMGYFSIDEPPAQNDGMDICKRGRMLYSRAHQADGYHPLFLNYSSGIPDGDRFVDWTDVLGTDPYWIPAGNVFRGNPNYVAKITALTDRRATPRRQPVWSIPMAAFWSGSYKRWIYPREQYCQTYLAIIYGAKIITYYFYPVRHQGIYDTLKQIAAETKILGPIITAPPVLQTVQYHPGAFVPEQNLYPDVHAAVFRNPAGGGVLLCANARHFPVDAEFSLSWEGIEQIHSLFDDKRSWPVKGSMFSDRLEPFGVRAYAWAAPLPESAAPVKLTVTAVPHPDQAAAEPPGVPRSGRPGKKNIMPNPSFEEASLPGLPDYYVPAGMPFDDEGLRIGQPDAPVGIAADQAFHGKQCLRMRAYRGYSSPTQIQFYIAPQEQQSCDYVLSVYMRSDAGNVVGSLQALTLSRQWSRANVKLTQEWQRLSIRGTIPPNLAEHNKFIMSVSGGAGDDVYVDAVQLERGSNPTDFEP